jgi:hypothetical protein
VKNCPFTREETPSCTETGKFKTGEEKPKKIGENTGKPIDSVTKNE